jgi:hypothetical protein
MSQTWSSWKRFPNAFSGDAVEAPIGPGVYEVRHTPTGREVAFGAAAHVANAIADLKVDATNGKSWRHLFRRDDPPPQVIDLEYRTYATGSHADAKVAARRLSGLRQTYWRRRMDLGWAARHSQ